MDKLILFLLSFCFVYFIYLITVVSKINKNDKFINSNQALYFKRVYKINLENINIKKFANIISLANSLIISLTLLIIDFFGNLFLKMIIGFIILIPLILLIYHIIGKIYKSKEK